jgi:methyl-accepting chemotaxis protein
MTFRNMKLSTRLILTFGLLLLGGLALGFTGQRSLKGVAASMDDMYTNWTVAIDSLGRASAAAQWSSRETLTVVLVNAPAETEALAPDIQVKNATFAKHLEEYRSTIVLERERELVKVVDGRWAGFISAQRRVLELQKTDNRAARAFYLQHGRPELKS